MALRLYRCWGLILTKMIPFVIPFVLYLLSAQFVSLLPNHYPLLYTFCVAAVGAVTFYLLRGRHIIRMHRNIIPGVIFGIVGIGLWILISQLQLEQTVIMYLPELLQPEQRSSFNPFLSIDPVSAQWGFIVIRLVGLALLVPVIEEIFWRGFLLRWVISSNWQDQELGVFTLNSFLWVTVLFALAHPEWLAAIVYFSLISVLFYWKRDLWNCIVAHSTSNLLLVVYILETGSWSLW